MYGLSSFKKKNKGVTIIAFVPLHHAPIFFSVLLLHVLHFHRPPMLSVQTRNVFSIFLFGLSSWSQPLPQLLYISHCGLKLRSPCLNGTAGSYWVFSWYIHSCRVPFFFSLCFCTAVCNVLSVDIHHPAHFSVHVWFLDTFIQSLRSVKISARMFTPKVKYLVSWCQPFSCDVHIFCYHNINLSHGCVRVDVHLEMYGV